MPLPRPSFKGGAWRSVVSAADRRLGCGGLRMTFAEAVISVFGSAAVLGVVMFCAYRVVGWARRQKAGAYFFGALFAPLIAAGKVTDPDSRVVMEAKRHKQHEEDEPGDPPTDRERAG